MGLIAAHGMEQLVANELCFFAVHVNRMILDPSMKSETRVANRRKATRNAGQRVAGFSGGGFASPVVGCNFGGGGPPGSNAAVWREDLSFAEVAPDPNRRRGPLSDSR